MIEFKNNVEDIRQRLSAVADPEIPSVSILEMGIVRDVSKEGEVVTVTITPTYSGCPAMKLIELDIVSTLKNAGYPKVQVKTSYADAWTTEWISQSGRRKLKEIGITPPHSLSQIPLQIQLPEGKIECAVCNSTNTKLLSEFGSTACKSYYYCNDCMTTFEYFKSL
ncbi:MAG: phenylacetate-CoA oxygenase subunit PaaJ [Bacteroidota bacterium]|nr:phenylacetate-CoA oxygenase subunit PaaJ [Bacteroidota bacterium]